VLPSLPGHTWRYSAADQLRHQYPVDAQPDGEGVITAACDRLAFAHRVDGPRSAAEPHCPDCLIATMADDAARVEQEWEARAHDQQAQLRGDTFDV